MSPQNGRRGYCAKYIQLIESLYGQKFAPVHYIPVWCTGTTGSAVLIWRNILVFHFCRLIYIQLIHLCSGLYTDYVFPVCYMYAGTCRGWLDYKFLMTLCKEWQKIEIKHLISQYFSSVNHHNDLLKFEEKSIY